MEAFQEMPELLLAPDGGEPERRWDRRGDDGVRVYLREIGRIPLLTAEQEVAIGRRIEDGQVALRRALLELPSALRALLALGDRLARGEVALDDVIVLADGGEPGAVERRRVLAAFRRLRRLAAALVGSGRRERMGRILAGLPLRPALVDALLNAAREEAARREVSLSSRLAARLAAIDRIDREVCKAKRELMEANLRLVVSIAKRYQGGDLPLLDLVQDGNLGLMKAVDRFQYRRGFKFSTYATWWIRQAISRALADRSRTIRLPVHLVEVLNRVGRLTQTLTGELGREPTPEELARRSGATPERVRLVLESARRPVSLDTPIGDDTELGDLLEDETAAAPADLAMTHDLTERVERALATLSPRERDILRMRFGIGEPGEHTLEAIGRRFAVTRERIRQIEAKALRKLRHPARAKELRVFVAAER